MSIDPVSSDTEVTCPLCGNDVRVNTRFLSSMMTEHFNEAHRDDSDEDIRAAMAAIRAALAS